MPDQDHSRISRREVLRRGALAAGAVVGGPIIAACGGSSTTSTSPSKTGSPTAATGTPKKGGVLRIGQSGGSSADQLDAYKIIGLPDDARLYQLYEWLTYRDHNFELKNWLAEEMAPNKKGDEWTVRIIPDVEFHNGKTLTADDVVYSFKKLLDPATGANARPLLNFMDPNQITKLDNRTVRFKFHHPFVVFPDRCGNQLVPIVPVGYDPKKPIGTGPFKFKSFSPGRQSVFTAWENYRGPGPYVDELLIIDYDDDTARVNALLSSQVDAIDAVPYSLIKSVENNSAVRLLIAETGAWRDIGMRVDAPPFDDARVRQAMRLLVNRKEMVEQAYSGQARIANDLYSPYDPSYLTEVPQREQDIEQAKALLKQAGHEGLKTTLVTSNIQAGVVDSCLVFAQQAKAAGVQIKVQTLEPTSFYNSQYEQRPFSVDWWSTNSHLTQVAYGDGPGAEYNQTHWENPKYESLYLQAIATLDESKRVEMEKEMQHMLYEEGGLMIFGFPNSVDAYSAKVSGFHPDKSGQALGSWDFKQVSFV